jgi:hypothetical protein
MKGKWAQGIQPRNFAWVIKDRLAVCERPGGYGPNHRRVRRQEEIIWIREQGFGMVVSIIPSTHNLHNYDELGVTYLHRPFSAADEDRRVLGELYPELHRLLAEGTKVLLHGEEVGDRVAGLIGGYIRWEDLDRGAHHRPPARSLRAGPRGASGGTASPGLLSAAGPPGR